jgi:hypothetical protein
MPRARRRALRFCKPAANQARRHRAAAASSCKSHSQCWAVSCQ